MPPKRSPKKMPATAEPKTKPVRVDLDPAIHHALRKTAADQNLSMAALARKLISEAMAGRKESAEPIRSPLPGKGRKGGAK